MEYCERGSLQDLINESRQGDTFIPETYVWNVLLQLSSALVYCHLGLQVNNERGVSSVRRAIGDWKPVLHRDVKPANVFLMNYSETDYDCVKLGDFGLGYILQDDTTPETYAGTAQYLAPEINRTSTRSIHWTEHCDIFSIGCTIYALCRLEPPFSYHVEAETEIYTPIPDHYSDQLRTCIASCLRYSPQTRPNALRIWQQSQRHVKPKLLDSREPIRPDSKIISAQEILGTITTNVTQVFSLNFSLNDVLLEVVAFGNADLTQNAVDMVGVDANSITPDLCGPREVASQNYWKLGRTLEGYSNSVAAVAFSSNGRQIPSASSDGTTAFKLVTSISAEENQRSRYETDRVESVGRYLATQVQPLHNRLRHKRNGEDQRKAPLLVRRSNRRKQTPSARTIDLGMNKLSTSWVWQAAKRGDLRTVKQFISKNAAVNHAVFGVTPLHWAAKNGSMEMVKILLESGADPNARDNKGCSVLICAASSGNLRMVKHLLSLDADADRADDEGSTALSVAAEKGHQAVVQYMLEIYNCNPNKPDNDGGTPISWAAWNGHLGTVQILASHGAVSNWKDQRWGRTPVSWAAENSHWEVVEFLIVQGNIKPD